MTEPRMLFANFICHFGESTLLDRLREIVLPGFLDDTLVRTYGDTTSFFFHQTAVARFDTGPAPTYAIYGRFVKNSTLQRSHRFEKQLGLISDDAALESAAFAFFVLILNNHKLLYLPETSYPPDLSSFAATTAHHLRSKRTQFINDEYALRKDTPQKITKKTLSTLHPKPRVECVPLASRSSIEEFLKHYARLRLVQFTLLDRNQESSARRWWEKMRKMRNDIGSDQTSLAHKSADGLDLEQAEQQIHEAASSGNQIVKLNGADKEGNVLRGNNESFQYTVSMPDLPGDARERAKSMLSTYGDLIESEALTIDDIDKSDHQALSDVAEEYLDDE